MDQSPQFAADLISKTAQAVGGSATATSPTDGVTLLDDWLSALSSSDAATYPIAKTISQLKSELQQESPRVGTIRPLIGELAEQTHQAAQQVDADRREPLAELAAALRGFGQQLLGNTADQARQGGMDDPTGSSGGLTDPSDMSGAPETGSPSVGGDRYGQ